MTFYPRQIEVCWLQGSCPCHRLSWWLHQGETASISPCLSSPGASPKVVLTPESLPLLTGVPGAASTQPPHTFLSAAGIYITNSGLRALLTLFPSPNGFSDFKASCYFWTMWPFPHAHPPREVAGFPVTSRSRFCQASLHFVMFPDPFLCYSSACYLFQLPPKPFEFISVASCSHFIGARPTLTLRVTVSRPKLSKCSLYYHPLKLLAVI